MNQCSEWQERVALFAGGDLPPAETAEVETHLADCACCRGFASELRADLVSLRARHSRAIAPEHYVRLRANVMQRVDAESRRWSWWKPALAFAVAAALLFAFFWPKPAPHPAVARRTPGPAPSHSPAPAHRRIDAPRFAVRTRPPHRHRPATIAVSVPVGTPAPAPDTAAEPLVVKLLTNDPNVVIYWITDTKGDY